MSSTADDDAGSASEDAWVFPMIQEIENHPCIWNLRHRDHKISVVKDRSWATVADFVRSKCGVVKTKKELETRWTTIVRAWRKRQVKPTGSAADTVKKSKYDLVLLFLHQRDDHAETIGNVNSPPWSSASQPLAGIRRPGSSADSYPSSAAAEDDDPSGVNLSFAGGPTRALGGAAAVEDACTSPPSTSTARPPAGGGPAKKRRRGSGQGATSTEDGPTSTEDVNALLLHELKKTGELDAQPKSRFHHWGGIVTQTLENLPRPIFKEKMAKLLAWVNECECAINDHVNDDDDDKEDDHESGNIRR